MSHENKYAVEMICSNCWQKVRMWFERGKEVPDKTACPTCGCYTLSQTLNAAPQCGEGNWMAQCIDTFFNGRKAS